MRRSTSARTWPKRSLARAATRNLRVQIPAFSRRRPRKRPSTRLKPQLEKIGAPMFFYQIIDPNKHPAQDTVNGIIMILSVMAMLSLALGLFLVINTVNAIVAQQVPQIGMMKAIGGTTRQMLLLYLSSVLIYGLLALLARPAAGRAGRARSDQLHAAADGDPSPIRSFASRNPAVIQQGSWSPCSCRCWRPCGRSSRGVRITVREAISNLWHRRQLTARACSIGC